jgi:hypothetical protein
MYYVEVHTTSNTHDVCTSTIKVILLSSSYVIIRHLMSDIS